MSQNIQNNVERLLEGTEIKINGSNPWDIQVKDERFYRRVITKGSLGFGESYMDGWWECEKLDELIARIMKHNVRKRLKSEWPAMMLAVLSILMNRQKGSRSFHIGKAHYDVGNKLYNAMLDKQLVYTCGYWKEANSLDEAQENKLDLVCRKIGIKSGDRVLDIGCGWGSFAKFAAKRYGAHVTGITVSEQQLALGKKRCKGLDVNLRLQDYRKVNEKFDHIVSLGMVEHVGYKNYKTYMQVAARNLKDNGFFLLHTIGSKLSERTTDSWIEKYIFPNSMLPSLAQLTRAAEGSFLVEDVQNFGADYDKTLMAWFENFDSHWGELKSDYDERFYRMWKYYLLACAGSFRSRKNQLWQIVLSKNGVPGVYESVR